MTAAVGVEKDAGAPAIWLAPCCCVEGGEGWGWRSCRRCIGTGVAQCIIMIYDQMVVDPERFLSEDVRSGRRSRKGEVVRHSGGLFDVVTIGCAACVVSLFWSAPVGTMNVDLLGCAGTRSHCYGESVTIST